MRHGLDREHGGYLTALEPRWISDRHRQVDLVSGPGSLDLATLYNTVELRPEWLEAARSGIDFLRRYGRSRPGGKLYFTVTREGQPLRMRRYVYSESFAAIANAAYAKATGDSQAAEEAITHFESYLSYSFDPGRIPPKVDTASRPMIGIGPLMISIATAQELRENLGDQVVKGQTCSAWIDEAIARIERHFLKPDHEAVMEVVGPGGEILDHFDGRQTQSGPRDRVCLVHHARRPAAE